MTVSRRTFLAGTAAVAGAGTLAACAPGSDVPGATPAEAGAPLVALADVPVGGAVAARTAAGDDVIVAQPQEGTVVAFSAVCTHQGCRVEIEGGQLVCPCHASVFDPGTGENLSGPAPRPLPPVAVAVADGQVVEA